MNISDTTNYNTIQQIQNLKNDGKEINLFIGRLPHEKLPENENNTVWVSLDNGNHFDFLPEEILQTIPKDRIHLIIDCNNSSQIETIKGLFLKVVVDQSTWKFMETGIIERLVSLLEPSEKSTLIFESSFQFTSPSNVTEMQFNHVSLRYPEKDFNDYFKNKRTCLINFCKQIGEERFKELQQEFLSTQSEGFRKRCTKLEQYSDYFLLYLAHKGHLTAPTDPVVNYIAQARQMTLEHLQTLFQNVVLHENTPSPYWTNYQSQYDTFFVAQGIKTEQGGCTIC